MDRRSSLIDDAIIVGLARSIRTCLTRDDCETCEYYKYDDYCTWELMRSTLRVLEETLYSDNTEKEDSGDEACSIRDYTP